MEQTQNYVLNGVQVNFNLDDYLKQSKDYTREQMPQFDQDAVISHLPMFTEYINVTKATLPVTALKPTQNEINYSKVLMHAIKLEPLADEQLVFICSNDLHIVDGHHRHVQCLISDPNREVTCYIFDCSIDELLDLFKNVKACLTDTLDIKGNTVSEEQLHMNLVKLLNESYGVQGPAAVPGIGAVVPAQPATADASGTKGSGDMMTGTMKFIKRDELKDSTDKWRKRLAQLVTKTQDESATGIGNTQLNILEEMLSDFEFLLPSEATSVQPFSIHDKRIGSIVDINGLEIRIQRFSTVTDDDLVMQFLGLTDNGQELTVQHDMTNGYAIVSESVTEAVVASKLAKHFDNAEGLEMVTCMNKPISRKCLRIDEPFSCNTMEGIVNGKAGDYLMRGIDGEVYPCDADIFHKTYIIQGEVEEPTE